MKHKTIIKMFLTFSMVFILFESCKNSNESNGGWEMVFRNNADGQVTFGNKSKLIEAVRLGYPVRIGWGSNRVEHIANADFLTIFQGKEVFAQINTIVGQAPKIENDSLKIRFRTQNHWTKLAGTNGYSTGFMTNYIQDTIVGGGMDRYTATTWYVLYPNYKSDIQPLPLWKKESPNWKEWKKNNE